MNKLKKAFIGFYRKMSSDTLSVDKNFDEKALRIAKSFTNFG